MAIFATFQILFILRVLCVFSFFFFLNRTTQYDYWFFVSTVYSVLFSILLPRHRKKKKRLKNYRWALENGRFSFFQNVCMKKLRVFCVNMHRNLQYGSQKNLNYRSQT